MEQRILDVRQEDEILWVTLNRPERMNALNQELVKELAAFFFGLHARRDARVVILTGAGRAFCAGLDLVAFNGTSQWPTLERLDSQRSFAEIALAMRRCPQPIIALVNGAATGAGFSLALAADIRLATPQARMSAAFIRVGLTCGDMGASYFLPRMVGASVAAEYMLTGRFMSADRACELGLVSRVVEPDALVDEGRALAQEMLGATPLGLDLSKEALNYAIDGPGLDAVIAMENRAQILAAADANFQEGISAFLEKRLPKFS